MANHLADQTSPYLLQHRDNPVDWRPWGNPALTESRETGKPILLSIGYAACHWCHVMAHESFENPAIAAQINALFIPIKVDREERPDLDAIYQNALSLTGQSGGWPLTMFLTPEGNPFWGGTYFPPTPRYGRPGLPEVLRAVADIWKARPEQVRANVDALRDGLAEDSRLSTAKAAPLSLSLLDEGARQILTAIDPIHGGLRGAPKFPQPGLIDLLWRAYLRTGNTALRDAVTLSLDHMAQGGIYDHLGGGFARYATDESWSVPHFEKMLYDNASLIDLYTQVWQGTQSPLYRQRVAETVEWVLREMTAEGGAFAASLDADSEGEEGRFYTWSADAIRAHLGPDYPTFAAAYDVQPAGNWEGRTILQRSGDLLSDSVEAVLADGRAVLWRDREGRVRPGRDDKILADWNGMMIAALANAAFVFAMPRWLDAARAAYDTVKKQMILPDGRLAHSMRFGRVGEIGLLDDLAHMARAALTLAEITGEPAFLAHATDWVAAAGRDHWDDSGHGWFQTATDAPDIIIRLKPSHDAAVPSANGIMIQVLARLAQATGNDQAHHQADQALTAFATAISQDFAQMAAILAGFEQMANPVAVVVIGDRQADDTRDLMHSIATAPSPTRVLITGNGGDIPVGHPAFGKGPVDGRSTAYVCRHGTCSLPVTEPEMLRDLLIKR